jgi:large subunit ribosomal protein L6
MSRIGKQPVALPQGVTVKVVDGIMEAQGPKGHLKRDTFGRVTLKADKGVATVELSPETETKYWGLYRTLLSNMVEGVSKGFRTELELQGVGYRAAVAGKTLELTVGFSHPVKLQPPEGIAFEVDAKTNRVAVVGANKELVGQVAAKVRDVRPPEPYHGKGIRYVGEKIVQKVGKSAAGGKK